MFYIFNNKNKCITSCDFEPNTEDIKYRNEFCIESDTSIGIGDTYINGAIQKDNTEKLTDYEIKARNYRNNLRNKIDNYIKPSSTINDELVTEDQKTMFINDSLLLARWPTTIGWPYVPLPELSNITLEVLCNPVWEFNEWK